MEVNPRLFKISISATVVYEYFKPNNEGLKLFRLRSSSKHVSTLEY